MNRIAIALLGVVGVAFVLKLFAGDQPPAAQMPSATPVLIELFTSEGCSSCPPADALLETFDTQPYPGAELIVLSEHVDYWNHIGWTDPYSSHASSERQSAYASHFHLDGPYTPQMIVDGSEEFVGSSAGEASKVFGKAIRTGKIAVTISRASLENNQLHAHVEVGPLPLHSGKADVVFAVALNHAESQVARGENAGRRLAHVAVVRSLSKVGKTEAGQPFSQDVSLKLDPGVDPASLRVIAFVQEPGPGRILGATLQKLAK
ncbi:MAG TPA: DUF1223 domain-containing protein [Terriglobales bacterium]|nr:DUF1223 domain-containing protein [Terriglobales bacterium]